MIFRVLPLRFEFLARTPVVFPPGKAGNIWRGAFGLALKGVCPPEVYTRLFEPRSEGGPSGLADPPRPFVLRAAPLDGLRFEPGEAFAIEANVFDLAVPAETYMRMTWQRVGEEGIGPARGRFDVRPREAPAPVAIDLAAVHQAHRVRVEFQTPAELKGAGEVRREPEFPLLFARLRDRISTLRALYQDGPLDIGFHAMAERAAGVRLIASSLRWEAVERRSSRSGQTHPLGGMTGWAEYAGALGEFLPYLEAGYWTGVGRQTVWGKGVIRTEHSAI